MSHRYHPDPLREELGRPDRADAIMFDDCPGCDQNAEHPLYRLDAENLPALWRRMRAVENGEERGYRSANEARAARVLMEVGGFLERSVVRIALGRWVATGTSARMLFDR